MSRLGHYWESLSDKPLRLAAAFIGLVALLLLLTNPWGSAWSHVGFVLMLVEVTTLTLVSWRRRA